jgi:hypothetical protein
MGSAFKGSGGDRQASVRSLGANSRSWFSAESFARKRFGSSLLLVSPLLFGAPVAIGIAISVVRLLGSAHPDLGWATTVNSDAEELYLGHTLYQNPAHGYTGQIYTPGFPALISVIYHIYFWNGWPLLVVIGASVSLVVLAARIAYVATGPATQVVRVLGAGGIGCIAYWCVSSIPLSLLDEARADQLAWAFALFGLVAVADFGRAPSRSRVVLAALLLSMALWTKQTTVSAAALAVVWVSGLAAASLLSRKAAWLFTAVLGGMNLALLLVLNLLTHGWEFYINFEMATHQATKSDYTRYILLGLRSILLAVAFLGVTWLASAVGVATSRRGRSLRSHARAAGGGLRSLLVAEDPTGRRVLLLGPYAVLGFALAVYFLRKQGTETNQFIGVVWALGLLAAAGWRVAQRHAPVAAMAGGCIVLFFVLALLGPIRRRAVLENAVHWRQVPSELRSWAGHHTLYAPLHADLNVPQGGPLYPNYYNFADVLAAGNQPMYLVRALLDRRFDGVELFELGEDAYTSGYGKWEENYLWKLNEVIRARYVAEPGLPRGVLARRSGPERAAWMRYCFSPFTAGGASFRIHRGGGFWCSFTPSHLRLVRTPAALSEVVTTQPVRVAGTVGLSLTGQPWARANLILEGGGGAAWMARVAASPGDSHNLTVSTYLGGVPLGSALVTATDLPGGRREVQLNLTPTHGRPGAPRSLHDGTATLTAPASAAPFAVVATSGVAIDLSAMRLGG